MDSGKNTQILDDPLHDSKIIHHLHEGNEEDDSGKLTIVFWVSSLNQTHQLSPTYHIHEEPMLHFYSLLVKEEFSSDETVS